MAIHLLAAQRQVPASNIPNPRGALHHAEVITPAARAPPASPRQGMGEPLSNYEAVRAAVAMMTDPRLFGLARRHVTVSTVGVVPRIRDMARDLPVRNLIWFDRG